MSAYSFSEYTARADTIASIDRYVQQGIPPGSFVEAVICNDLAAAVGRADDDNLRNLPAIVSYLYNECPSACWKSTDHFKAWLARFRAEAA